MHCYRMLGSFDEAEDLTQETFLRAWQGLASFEGRSSLRAWLYRIATNVCLDALKGRARRTLPDLAGPPLRPGETLSAPAEHRWVQPFPDRLLDEEPGAAVVAAETMELAFLAAIQALPPRQRAALIVRDVLGWSAGQCAELLGCSEAAANSAIQRARAAMRDHLPARRMEWRATNAITPEEIATLRRYMAAVEHADLATVAELLAEDVKTTMPPYPEWLLGRSAVMAALTASWDTTSPIYVGRFRMQLTRANRRPAIASYVRSPGDDRVRAFAIGIVRVAHGRIAEITGFHDPGLFPAFGLPLELADDER